MQTARLYPIQLWLAAALWAALLASGARLLLRERPWRGLSAREALFLAATLALAAGLRLSADPFPADIRSAYEMGSSVGRTHLWAAGYSAFLHALFLAAPASFETACTANVALGTLTVAALYWLVDAVFEDRRAALAAAAVLASLPIAARFSASDSAHVLSTLCLLLGLACAASWAKRGGGGWLTAAMGWLALAANVRAESLVFLPAAAALAWACRAGVLERPWAAAAPALLLIVPAFDLRALWLASGETAKGTHLLMNPWFVGPHASSLAALFSLLGAAVLASRRETRRLGAGWLLATALVSMPGMYSADPAHDTNYRYFLPLLAMFCVPAGVGLSYLLEKTAGFSRPWAGAALVALPLAGAAPAMGFLHKAWTHQLEFFFVRRALPLVSDGCAIVRRARWRGDSGLEVSPAASAEAGRSHRWVDTDVFLGSEGFSGCAVFYQSASCFSEPSSGSAAIAECRSMRERFRLEPLETALLPALPYAKERYVVDPVPVGFYRVLPRESRG